MSPLLRVRHAQIERTGICYGRADVPVVQDPRLASAYVVAQLIAGVHEIERVVTSPSLRTHELAIAVGRRLGVPVVVDERLVELSFGEWEGRLWSDLERDDAARLQRWMTHWRTDAPPGGESVDALVERVRAARSEWAEEAALLVTHAGVMRTLRALDRGLDYADVVGEPVVCLRVEAGDRGSVATSPGG